MRKLSAVVADELARIMGASVGMIAAHYGALIDTTRESLLERLEASLVNVAVGAAIDPRREFKSDFATCSHIRSC